jgi:hypothetical protein
MLRTKDYVIESNNRQKDTAVIEAFNVGDMEDAWSNHVLFCIKN